MTGESSAQRCFVGRSREIGELRFALSEALAGRGRMFLLAGEAGIGKTCLADRISSEASAAGACVSWGRCWEGGDAPAFWPWVQILRSCQRQALTALQGSALAASLLRLTEAGSEGSLQPPHEHTAAADLERRFHLFDSVTQALKQVMTTRPSLLVLDDLHAADEASLSLLLFFARELRDTRTLVIGTLRDAEARRGGRHPALFRALQREASTLHLTGFKLADTGTLIEGITAQPVPAALIDAVHHTTEGNPFFVSEIARALPADTRAMMATGEQHVSLPIPDEVRDAVRHRLAPLSDELKQWLAIAAVIGKTFDARVVERVMVAAADTLPANVDSALALEVVVHDRGGERRWRFAHALIADTLYDDLGQKRQAELHLAVARAMEDVYGAALDAHLSELAHHFLSTATLAERRIGVTYALRAGRRALALLAREDAARWFERALATCAEIGASEHERCDILLALGAAFRQADNEVEATRTFRAAAEIARRIGAKDWFVHAVIGAGAIDETGTRDRTLVALLEEALALLSPGDSVERVLLLGRLAETFFFWPQSQQGETLSAEAVAVARRLGHPAALVAALGSYHFILWKPGLARRRLAIADELLEIGARHHDSEATVLGHFRRLIDLLELGQIATVIAEIEQYEAAATRFHRPTCHWKAALLRSTVALMQGRLAAAEAWGESARKLGERVQAVNALQFYSLQMFMLRLEQGRLAELEQEMRTFAAHYRAVPAWRVGLAFLWVETGRREQAQREVDHLAQDDFAGIPNDSNWLSAMSVLAETAIALADRERARILYEQLLPHAEYWVVGGGGVLNGGPVVYYLGRLATFLHATDAAHSHFEQAIRLTTGAGARTWLVYAQLGYAKLVLQGGALLQHALPQAQRRIEAAGKTAHELGLLRAGRYLQRARDEIDAAVAPPQPTAGTTDRRPHLYRQGDCWLMSYGGNELRLRETKGLHYLAYLLAHPRERVRAARLQAIATAAAQAVRADGSGGPVSAPDTNAMHERRVEDLRGDLATATAPDDLARQSQAQCELDSLAQDPGAAAAVPGDRPGIGGATGERARLNVTRALAATIRSVAKHDEHLGIYLSRSVKTGNFCVYDPDRPDA